jgi:5-methylcytosine-specific restriction endonuclease McrA
MEGSKRRHIPHSVVSEVYRRDGARCVICGSTENLQLDHIIPFSKGGADTAENLQVLCQKCNLEKSNKI